MKIYIEVESASGVENINVNLKILPSGRCDNYISDFDPKFKKFQKDHGFSFRDHDPRIFDLYLRLCAAGLL